MKKSGITLPSIPSIIGRYQHTDETENILMVGTIGAGKSATINTVMAAVAGEWLYKAPVGPKIGQSKRRTTTHLIWYEKCGISKIKQKEMRIPKHFPNLVDMTGLSNDNSGSQRQLLDLVLTGRIPNKTSIPAVLDVQKSKGEGSFSRMFPIIYPSKRIHKIVFVASSLDEIPTELIKCVKSVAQPDGNAGNLNPRYIPIFGVLTKTDMAKTDPEELKAKEREFLECLGIDYDTSYSRWQNSTNGSYSLTTVEFVDRLFSPDVRYVLDQGFSLRAFVGGLLECGPAAFSILLGSMSFLFLAYWISISQGIIFDKFW